MIYNVNAVILVLGELQKGSCGCIQVVIGTSLVVTLYASYLFPLAENTAMEKTKRPFYIFKQVYIFKSHFIHDSAGRGWAEQQVASGFTISKIAVHKNNETRNQPGEGWKRFSNVKDHC